ncbi:hypothetical protein CCACVL1_28161 [Corchorus capsularis]|uniref:TMEM205-like domain-containing protein n=1 Tax=Corchorus capsularis TaxID=210143 RepID=A0A1R3G7I7_COCAP|nr:hypothetical protein CCACVL1_28161 [Corchorus capsularis]
MMNILALSLVLSSLAAAGVWSPAPQREDVIVKEGHRVIVVEYDEDGKHNTKVSISPTTPPQQKPLDEAEAEAASTVLPNLGQGISSQGKATICDAFGKCTEKMANAFGKARGKVEETFQDTSNQAKDKAKDIKGALGTAKEAIKETAKKAGEDIVSNASEGAKEAKHKLPSRNKLLGWVKYMTTSMDSALILGTLANLVGLATAYGMSVWVTFISSDVLARLLPRQQFGVVQSKIYPVYFRAMAYSIGLALLGHFLGQRRRLLSSKPEMFQAFDLLSSLFLVLFNALYLEPKATKVMFERMKMEKEQGRGRDDFTAEAEGANPTEPPLVADPAATTKTREAAAAAEQQVVVKSRMARLNERLKKLNSTSSLVNVLTLMALTCHLVYLAHRLSLHC